VILFQQYPIWVYDYWLYIERLHLPFWLSWKERKKTWLMLWDQDPVLIKVLKWQSMLLVLLMFATSWEWKPILFMVLWPSFSLYSLVSSKLVVQIIPLHFMSIQRQCLSLLLVFYYIVWSFRLRLSLPQQELIHSWKCLVH